MPIRVTGPGKFRHSAHAEQFGVIFRVSTRIPNSTDYWIQTHTSSDFFSTGPTQPVVIFDDEDVLLDGMYRTSSNIGFLPWLKTIGVRAVVEVTIGDGVWSEVTAMSKTPSDRGIALAARFRLQPGATAFRVRVTEGFWRFGTSYESPPLQVHVKRAPAILTFIAMGGSSSIGSGSSGPSGASVGSGGSGSSSSSSSTSGSSGSSSSSGDGITVDPTKCGGVDPTLIQELMQPNNVQCNNLCAGCVNFIEHLGLRVLEEESLASVLDTLRHKENASEEDFCTRRTNPNGISHRIVLGKWENSEHELLRPAGIKTFESILDEFEQDGGGTLLIVANSLAGAKLQATITYNWRWENNIDIALFVAWDITHTGGAIGWLGSRPARVVNFFQTGNLLWFQNGGPISEADVETDLTGCFSHNALARSAFVHEETYNEVREALARIRAVARDE